MMDILHQTIIEQRNYIIDLEIMLQDTYDLLADKNSILHDVKDTVLQITKELLETGYIKR